MSTSSTLPFLPFALPAIGQEEIDEVVDSLRNGWLTTGPKCRRFEEDFAAFVGTEGAAIAVNSATAGLHLAVESLGIGPGDQVIVPTWTFTSTAEVVRYLGAEPVLVDVDERTLNLAPEELERQLAAHDRVKAVMPVHFAGLACELGATRELCARHGAALVEDAAHALPTTWNDELVGSRSELAVYSFYATKTIATGEGGMVVVRDPERAARMRTMRLHGIDRDAFDRYSSEKPAWYYEVVAPGFKYNMGDLAAALGIHQLKKARALRDRRAAIAARYSEAFADLPLRLPAEAPGADVHAWHLYVVRLTDDAPLDRDAFIARMSAAGIGTSVHFIPLHQHPYWRDFTGLAPEDLPVAHDSFGRAVSLPLYPTMTEGEVERVVEAARGILLGRG